MKKPLSFSALVAVTALAVTPIAINAAPVFGDTNQSNNAVTSDLHGQAPSKGFVITYKAGTAEAEALATDEGAVEGVSALDTEAQSTVAEATDSVDAKVEATEGGGADTAVVALDRDLTDAESEEFMETLESDAAVEAVEPNLLVEPEAFTPNDPYFSQQWSLKNTAGGTNVQGAWDYSRGAGTVVATLDTGVAPHWDVYRNLVAGFDFVKDLKSAGDGNGRDGDPTDPGEAMRANGCWAGFPATDKKSGWHGTHVAGIVAAQTNNGYGVAGVAPNAKVQPIRVMGKCGGMSSDVVDAITWASGGHVPGVVANPTPATVINLSLSTPVATCPTYYQKAIDGAVARGTTVVVAAGNASKDARNFAPANCNNVIVVGAVGAEGGSAYYSNYGKIVDLYAPGGDLRRDTGIINTVNGSTTTPDPKASAIKTMEGTSMAAPHVAGIVALMKAVNPRLTPARVESILKSTTKPVKWCTYGSGQCGVGIPDARAAVLKAHNS